MLLCCAGTLPSDWAPVNSYANIDLHHNNLTGAYSQPKFQSDSLTHAMISSRMSRTFQNLLLVPLTRARAFLYLPFLITLAMISGFARPSDTMGD